MDFRRRQNFDIFNGGHFTTFRMIPQWPYQPYIFVPKTNPWTRPYMTNSQMMETNRADLKIKSKSRAQKVCDFERLRKFREKKLICSLLPCSDLSDKEFIKLFSRPANLCEKQDLVNDSLVCSLKLAEDKIKNLQTALDKLKTAQHSEQERQAEVMEQLRETTNFHKFNTEMCRLKILDLEERNRQLQESFHFINTACQRLVEDKEKLTSAVQSCFENLDSYKNRKVKPGKSTRENIAPSGNSDSTQNHWDRQLNCEWCSIVKAFYQTCMPT